MSATEHNGTLNQGHVLLSQVHWGNLRMEVGNRNEELGHTIGNTFQNLGYFLSNGGVSLRQFNGEVPEKTPLVP